ncbi:hypothetical protein YC2023_021458 [Brassica napus]
MNSALHFAFPAANPTFVCGIRRVTPSPGLLCSRLRVFSLPPPYSSSLKVVVEVVTLCVKLVAGRGHLGH